ncbi:Integrator complex subunit 2 [Geranomyces michiganensis]|nr:Integrator complex subunit 2 [Geranomyces michiganensis]
MLTERLLLPLVSLQLSLDYCKDERTYLNSTFSNSHRPYLPRNHPALDPLLRRVLMSAFPYLYARDWDRFVADAELLSHIIDPSHRQRKPQPLPESEECIILRILCGMAGMLGYTYPKTALQLSLRMPQSGSTDRRSQLYLCFLILCADQYARNCMDEFTETLSHVFNSRHSDLSLMILVFVHTGQLLEVESVVRKTLNMPVQIPRDGLHQLRTILTQRLFSTSEMVRRALVPRPVGQSESFAIVVVYHLLRQNLFETNGIDVRDWIFWQIKNACLPLHPLLPDILELYVERLAKRGAISRISDRDMATVFSDTSLLTPSHVIGCHYVLLYRAILAKLQQAEPEYGGPTAPKAAPLADYYLPSLPTKRILYHAETDGDHQAYRLLYPKLAGLVAEQEPQILDFAGLVGQEEEEALRAKQFAVDASMGLKYKELFPKEVDAEHRDDTKDWLAAALEPEKFTPIWRNAASDTLSAIKALQILQALPPATLAPFLSPVMDSLLPVLVVAPETETMAALESHFQQLWTKFYTYFPQKTCLETTRILTHRPGQTSIERKTLISALVANRDKDDDSDLVSDPLLVFGCDSRVWRSRLGVKIALQALAFYMTASRHRYAAAFRAAAVKQRAGLTDAHITTLLQAQDTAVIQMLLETCVPPARGIGLTKSDNGDNDVRAAAAAEEEEEEDAQRRRVAQRPIMLFVHQLFMDPAYIRLVHFQMYDARLIPLMVAMVPSMHFCFSFIPELIGAPKMETQMFGLQLMAHLGEKYPIEQSLQIATTVALPRVQAICANHVKYARAVRAYVNSEKMLALQNKARQAAQQLQQQLLLQPPPPPPRNAEEVRELVPLLYHYAHAFPTLAESVCNILEELQLIVPVSQLQLPGAPLIAKSTVEFIGRLQETVAVTFGRVVRDVIMVAPGSLDKSII